MESIDMYDLAIYRLQPVESLASSAAVLLNEKVSQKQVAA